MSDDKTGEATDIGGDTPIIGNAVLVGDRFRFTFDAAKFILAQENSSTVVVKLDEIVIEADGCKKLIVVPE